MDDEDAFLYGETKPAPQPEPGTAAVAQVPAEASAPAPEGEDQEEAMDEGEGSDSDDEELEIIIDENAAAPPSKPQPYGQRPQPYGMRQSATPGTPQISTPVQQAAANLAQSGATVVPTTVLPPGRPASPALAVAEPAPGFDATLPATLKDETSLIDVDIDTLAEKPWQGPGAYQADYFNYGFDETTWKIYVARQRSMRDDVKQDQEQPFKIFAEMPLADAWNALSPELKGQMMQTIVGGGQGAMNPMMMMGMPPMGMPAMPGMPSGPFPPTNTFDQDSNGPRGTKRHRGDGESFDAGSMSGMDGFNPAEQFGGGPPPGMDMSQMPPFNGDPQAMMAMMQQNGGGMDSSMSMDPYQQGMMGTGRGRGSRGRGRGGRGGSSGKDPFGLSRNAFVMNTGGDAGEDRPVSPLPGNVPTGPRSNKPPPTGPRAGRKFHQDKDRSYSAGGSELDYGDGNGSGGGGGGQGGERRSSKSYRRRHDHSSDEEYGSTSRRRSSRRSASPTYDDYA